MNEYYHPFNVVARKSETQETDTTNRQCSHPRMDTDDMNGGGFLLEEEETKESTHTTTNNDTINVFERKSETQETECREEPNTEESGTPNKETQERVKAINRKYELDLDDLDCLMR